VGQRIHAAAWLAILLLFLAGCAARPPVAVETSMMQRIKRTVTVGDKDVKNPIDASPENIDHGRKVFANYCMVCHGLDGQNSGVPFADRMSPPVPLLTSAGVQAYTDGQLKWIIANGIFPSGMPASSGILSEDEMWKIVTYVRNLPPKGTLGEPAVYGGTPMEPPVHSAERR
jgi:mono/diheme cytochrome c family protein